MTDEQVEKIIKSNMMLQMNLAGIRADFEESSQRTWVGLTPEEEEEIITKAHSGAGWRFYIREAEAKLKEKNT